MPAFSLMGSRAAITTLLWVLVRSRAPECRDGSVDDFQVEDASVLQVQVSERASSVLSVNETGWMHHGSSIYADDQGFHPADGTDKHCRPINADGEVTGLQVRIRKEIHKMTDAEFDKFSQCVRKMKDLKPTCTSGYRCIQDYPNTWDSFLAFHMNCHQQESEFWVCHRHMMYDLETSLQKLCNDCSITLPYWNSFREAGNLWGSTTWAPNRYGNPFGLQSDAAWWCYDHGWSQCVMEGIGKGFVMNPDADQSTCAACLSRQPYRWAKVSSLPVVMATMTAQESFETIQSKFDTFHVGIHTNVGGNMANLPDSTLDPVFWLHHGVVDFMFTFWQAWQHNNEQTHPTCRSCSTCNQPMTYYGVPRTEWMGRWNSELNCVEVPCSNPVACIGYDGYIEPGVWNPPAPPPPPPRPHRWQRRWHSWLQNETKQEPGAESLVEGNVAAFQPNMQVRPVIIEAPNGHRIVESASRATFGSTERLEQMECEETFNKIQKGTCSLGEISKHVVLTAKQDMQLARTQCADFFGTLRGMVPESTVERRISECWKAAEVIEKVQNMFRYKEPESEAEKVYGIACRAANLRC